MSEREEVLPPSAEPQLDTDNTEAQDTPVGGADTKKKSNYVWRPPKEPTKAPSFSPCPHLYFKSEIVTRHKLSRKRHTALLATPNSAPWRGTTSPTDVPLLRYKTRPLSARNMELALPKRNYVKAQCEEYKNTVTPEMMERLQRVLEDEFHMSPEEIKKFIKTDKKAKKHKPNKIEENKEKDKKVSLSSRDWLAGLVEQLTNRAAEALAGGRISSMTSSQWIQGLVSGAAEIATNEAEQKRPSRQLEGMVKTILQRIVTKTGDNQSEKTGNTSTAKLMSMVTQRMTGWLEDVVNPNTAENLSWFGEIVGLNPSTAKKTSTVTNNQYMTVTGSDSTCGRIQSDKKHRGQSRGRPKSHKRGHKKRKIGKDDDYSPSGCRDEGYDEKRGQSQSRKQKDVKKRPEKRDVKSAKDLCTCTCTCDAPKDKSAGKTGDPDAVGQGEGDVPESGTQEGPQAQNEEELMQQDLDVMRNSEETDEETADNAASLAATESVAPNESVPPTESIAPTEIEAPTESVVPTGSEAPTDSEEPNAGIAAVGEALEEILLTIGKTAEEADAKNGEAIGDADTKANVDFSEAQPETAGEIQLPEGTTNLQESHVTDLDTEGNDFNGKQSTVTKKSQTHTLTPDLIYQQLVNIITEAPNKDKTDRKDKLSRALEAKFASIKTDGEDESQLDDKEAIKMVADKIANWIEIMIEESDATDSAVQNNAKKQSGRTLTDSVTSTIVREWAESMESAMAVADAWAAWISKTVRDAEEKTAKKKGQVLLPNGEVDKLRRQEWSEWKNNVRKQAIDFRMKKKEIAETAHEWTQFTKDRPVKSSADAESTHTTPQESNSDAADKD